MMTMRPHALVSPDVTRYTFTTNSSLIPRKRRRTLPTVACHHVHLKLHSTCIQSALYQYTLHGLTLHAYGVMTRYDGCTTSSACLGKQ